MTVNEEIIKTLKASKIRLGDGICYLLSLYHGYKPTYIPEELKTKIHISKIVVEKDGNLHWNVPLYNDQITNFDWVESEYINKFYEKNPARGRYKRECIKRMKEFFAENPDVRKDEVIGATTLYLSQTDPDYIRKPHFWISKGVGVSKQQDILEWIERYREATEPEEENRSVTRKLQ
jgi:hypothetical protein